MLHLADALIRKKKVLRIRYKLRSFTAITLHHNASIPYLTFLDFSIYITRYNVKDSNSFIFFFLIRYVTRYNVKDSSRHVILGTQQFKPLEFSQQINLRFQDR